MTESAENKPKPARNAGKIIARNTAFGVGAQFLLRIISFLFTVLIVHRIGDAEFGQYSIVLAWTGLFSVLGDLGITQYFAREVAREPQKNTELFWDMVSLRGLMAIFAAVVPTLGAVLHPYPSVIVLAIFLYTLTYFLQAFLVPLTSLITGNERVDITAAFDVIGQVVFIGAGALFLIVSKDFIWLIVASFINIPVLIGLGLWFTRRNQMGPPRFHVNPRLWWVIVKAGLPFAFIQLALSFSFRVDTIILSSWVSDSQIGWYNIAYGLSLNFLTITRAFNNAILPTLAREHASAPENTRPWYYRSVKIMMFIGLPIAVGCMLLADRLIPFIYGDSNRIAAIPFLIIIWDMPIVMYTAFCGNLTTSIREERSAARVYITLGVANIILNAILIPHFGIIGASFTTVLTDLIGAIQFYLLFRRVFGAGLGLKYLLRVVLAAFLMGVVILLLMNLGLNFLLIIPVAGLIYLLLIWLTNAFTLEERTQLIGVLKVMGRRLRPQPG